ncbi:MAG: tripartite tricarboxylate transporter substrate binding protein [Betaproteobacteria bacterium]|nr:tripartite tricarboxylate transporter substrate binding protein [Betaproteobacteria bacterium]
MRKPNAILPMIAMLLAAVIIPAGAQTYPAKPIRNILTYSGGAEPIARIIAQKLGEAMGQPLLLEPQTGANGSVGAGAVARSAPDGYTILGSTGATQIIRGFLVKDVPYDPFRDFTPIIHTFDAVSTIVAHPSAPASLKELIEFARRNPGKVSFGTTGTGSAYHLAGELIQLLTGAKLLHVPYKSSPQSLTDLVAGRIDTAFSVYATTRQFVESGKAKNIALLNNGRFTALADLPVVSDVIPGFQSPPLWGGYFGPAGVPQGIVTRLNGELNKALALPDVKALMERGGLAPAGGTPEQLAAMMRTDVERLQKIVKAAGIVPE